MKRLSLAEALRINVRQTIVAAYLVIALMMMSMSFTLVQLAERFVPEWNGIYILPICFFLSIEGMYTQRALRRSTYTLIDRIIFHTAEWVVILIVLRLLLFFLRGIGDIWFDIPLLEENFFGVIFSTEFIFLAVVGFFVWDISARFAADMFQFEGDEGLLKVEEDGGTIRIRSEIRQYFADRVIIIGAGMVILTALLRFDAQKQAGIDFQSINVLNLIVYFLLGLTLLSIIQFSIQRIHWVLDKSYIHVELGKKWFLYSFAFIGLVTLLALLLPTQYSIGFLSSLQSIFTFILGVITTILALVSIPFIWFFGFLMSLLGGKQTDTPPPTIDDIVKGIPTPQPGGNPWYEILKSILFWTLLFGVIVVSFVIYFREHGSTFNYIRNISIVKFFGSVYSWLKSLILGINDTITKRIGHSIQRIRTREFRLFPRKDYKYINPRNLAPRERIIFYYLSLLRRGEKKGWTREPSQTPYEYSKIMAELIAKQENRSEERKLDEAAHKSGGIEIDMDELTDRFVEAKYSQHEITKYQSEQVRDHWLRLIHFLRNIRSK